MGSVRIKINNAGLTAARLKKVFEKKALPILSEQILTDCNTYVRMQSGALAGSAEPERGGWQIRWDMSYAKKVYYTGTPRKNKNPLASLRWCEKAKRYYAKDWSSLATKLVRGG